MWKPCYQLAIKGKQNGRAYIKKGCWILDYMTHMSRDDRDVSSSFALSALKVCKAFRAKYI